ncbi:putative extracellular rhs repeat protein [Streptomyces venezuelae]|nr:putative extracellular rhs repeat protein [Streptomyces venezuelae]CUM36950.1 putative large secreted protein [Streptomyces venezuelae]
MHVTAPGARGHAEHRGDLGIVHKGGLDGPVSARSAVIGAVQLRLHEYDGSSSWSAADRSAGSLLDPRLLQDAGEGFGFDLLAGGRLEAHGALRGEGDDAAVVVGDAAPGEPGLCPRGRAHGGADEQLLLDRTPALHAPHRPGGDGDDLGRARNRAGGHAPLLIALRRDADRGGLLAQQPQLPRYGHRRHRHRFTHLGAREYDQSTGCFLSADPILDLGDPLQINGYAYADNSPITKSEPDGLLPIECWEGTATCSGNTIVAAKNPAVQPTNALTEKKVDEGRRDQAGDLRRAGRPAHHRRTGQDRVGTPRDRVHERGPSAGREAVRPEDG